MTSAFPLLQSSAQPASATNLRNCVPFIRSSREPACARSSVVVEPRWETYHAGLDAEPVLPYMSSCLYAKGGVSIETAGRAHMPIDVRIQQKWELTVLARLHNV
jgi:hypothetical protein